MFGEVNAHFQGVSVQLSTRATKLKRHSFIRLEPIVLFYQFSCATHVPEVFPFLFYEIEKTIKSL